MDSVGKSEFCPKAYSVVSSRSTGSDHRCNVLAVPRCSSTCSPELTSGSAGFSFLNLRRTGSAIGSATGSITLHTGANTFFRPSSTGLANCLKCPSSWARTFGLVECDNKPRIAFSNGLIRISFRAVGGMVIQSVRMAAALPMTSLRLKTTAVCEVAAQLTTRSISPRISMRLVLRCLSTVG